MERNIYVVIMAGGSGTRFWPYSRNAKPKQFLDVLGIGKSLLQLTYERFLAVTDSSKIYVVTNHEYVELTAKQLPELKPDQILSEPTKRNTAPCIAYAAYKIHEKDPKAIMIVTPADHAIFKEAIFIDIVNQAVNAAKFNDKLITIGIKPNRPETGYGYIQFLPEQKDGVNKVKTFTEKPHLDLAKKFIESGDFVWNAGIFVWDLNSIIQAFEKHLPDMAEAFQAGKKHFYRADESKFIEKCYSECKNISIDYGIMEKAENVYVIMGDFGWSDLGSWGSLHELREKDEHQNVIDGSAILYHCDNNFFMIPQDKIVVAQDLSGFLVADIDNVLIICKKDQEAMFREYVADVKSKKGEKFL